MKETNRFSCMPSGTRTMTCRFISFCSIACSSVVCRGMPSSPARGCPTSSNETSQLLETLPEDSASLSSSAAAARSSAATSQRLSSPSTELAARTGLIISGPCGASTMAPAGSPSGSRQASSRGECFGCGSFSGSSGKLERLDTREKRAVLHSIFMPRRSMSPDASSSGCGCMEDLVDEVGGLGEFAARGDGWPAEGMVVPTLSADSGAIVKASPPSRCGVPSSSRAPSRDSKLVTAVLSLPMLRAMCR
mmetsp:Transcript_50547/g.145751  ORF Transcript_50547/g.145751 Transcript_50547/m.145751 type:complete len:249 (-) Transcript_50547:1568-2314(-)